MDAGALLARVRRVVGEKGAVSLHEPTLPEHAWDYVKTCSDTGWVSSAGAYVERFERRLADLSGALTPLFEARLAQRSQDLPPLYCPSGAVWWARESALRRERTFHLAGRRGSELPWQRALDINDEADFALAETLVARVVG